MKKSLVLIAVAFTLSACGQSEKTLRIGYLGPLTGDAVSIGMDTLNGARIAVDEVNAAGGVNGRKVELIAEDGKCNGADTASAVQKLINVDQVVAIIGGACSSETLAAAPIAEAAKVVMLSPLSSSQDITNAGEYIFRNYPSDGLKGKALGAYFKKAGFTNVAIISENTDFCQSIRTSIKNNLPEGVKLVFDENVDLGTKDYRSLMTRLKALDFDVFITNGQSDATIAEMAKQLRTLGMKQQMVGTDTADSVILGTIAKDAVEGLKILSVPSLSESNPAASAFAMIFRQRYEEPKKSMFFAALAYDATHLLLKTIGAAGTGEKLKHAFEDLKEYQGIAGTFHFDKNGDVVGIPFAMKEFKNGVPVQSEILLIE